MVTLLGRGVLRLESVGPGEGAGTRRFNVQGGFLQVADNVVRLVTESAEPVATSAA
jgi:F-type H+-transporting ATPase subunit epsilon